MKALELVSQSVNSPFSSSLLSATLPRSGSGSRRSVFSPCFAGCLTNLGSTVRSVGDADLSEEPARIPAGFPRRRSLRALPRSAPVAEWLRMPDLQGARRALSLSDAQVGCAPLPRLQEKCVAHGRDGDAVEPYGALHVVLGR